MADCSGCPSHDGCASANEGGCSTVPNFFSMTKGSSALVTVAVGSGKGGVGKSTVTALLAVILQQAGYKVGILDADITGPSMAHTFGLEHGVMQREDQVLIPARTSLDIPLMSLNLLLPNKGDPVVWRGPVIVNVIKQFWSEVEWGKLDVLLLDMPPGTGDIPLTVFQSLPVDRFLLVSTPQDLVQMIVSKAAKMAAMLNVPLLGLVENMSSVKCPDCGKVMYPFGHGKTAAAAAAVGTDFLDEMPIDPALAELIDAGKIEYLPQTTDLLQNSKAAIAALIDRKKAIIAKAEAEEN